MGKNKILFINAKVWQPHGRFDEAFGLSGNRFDFLGTTIKALRVKSNYAETLDLNGRLVLPGLIDGHLHLCHGSQMQKTLDAGKISSINQLKVEVKKFAEDNQDMIWIIGKNLKINTVLAETDSRSGNILDPLFSGRPLYIANYDHHSAVCNSKAIEMSGLSQMSEEFSNSEIETGNNGKLTGIIRESALDFVRRKIPAPAIADKCDALRGVIKMLNSFGITSVSDITQPEDIETYLQMYNENKLKLRINSYIPLEEIDRIEEHVQTAAKIKREFYSIKGFKAYYDGALGSETALFSMNYKRRSHNGYETSIVKSGTLNEFALKIDKQGGQLIIHAIGDQAVSGVLSLYDNLAKSNGKRDSRHRIEHAQHINEKDLSKFKELGVIASVQPLHLKYDIETVKVKLPAELIDTTHNYKRIIDRGATINFGTDFPIVTANPFENMKMAITRNSGSGVFSPENCIELHNCIKAYTINNAYSNFNEKELGTISPGKLADFVIMEDDLFEMKSEDLGTARVNATYVDGERVFSVS